MVGQFQRQIDQLNDEVASLRKMVDVQGFASLASPRAIPSRRPLSPQRIRIPQEQPKSSNQHGRSGKPESHQSKKSTASPPRVNSARRKTGSVVGTGQLVNSKIKAAVITPKTSIYVGHLCLDVRENDIKDHLLSFFPNQSFSFEQLQVKSGQYSSFRIEIDVDLVEKILDPSVWPEKVVVKRFRFFRTKK